MKLQNYINEQFESVDNEGISKIQLNSEVKDFEVVRNDENIKIFKVRFEGYNDQTSHPCLREPRNDGWFVIRFDNDGEWFFYDYE